MVLIESIAKENAYQLRDYLFHKVLENVYVDPFKCSFLRYLALAPNDLSTFDITALTLYQRCAIAGLGLLEDDVSNQDLSRLLGQAARIDSTPMPWVSDVFGVMAVKWLVGQLNEDRLSHEYEHWTASFLTQQLRGSHFNLFERDIATYVMNGELATYTTACIPLFLHYRTIRPIDDHQRRVSLFERFMQEFRDQAKANGSATLWSLMIYCFDQINQEVAIVPPKGWTLTDLMNFLNSIPTGLKRWTWEEKGRTKGAEPIKWHVKNEYHVQNLLYVLLAPVFNDIADEVYLVPVGQKSPRIDLYLPTINTLIEVKYRKDTKKSFQDLIGEIAEDASLYRSDTKYKNTQIICFLWDCTRSTQEHAKFREGVLKLDLQGCVVINAPSTMHI